MLAKACAWSVYIVPRRCVIGAPVPRLCEPAAACVKFDTTSSSTFFHGVSLHAATAEGERLPQARLQVQPSGVHSPLSAPRCVCLLPSQAYLAFILTGGERASPAPGGERGGRQAPQGVSVAPPATDTLLGPLPLRLLLSLFFAHAPSDWFTYGITIQERASALEAELQQSRAEASRLRQEGCVVLPIMIITTMTCLRRCDECRPRGASPLALA
jgi:hypothetical protein